MDNSGLEKCVCHCSEWELGDWVAVSFPYLNAPPWPTASVCLGWHDASMCVQYEQLLVVWYVLEERALSLSQHICQWRIFVFTLSGSDYLTIIDWPVRSDKNELHTLSHFGCWFQQWPINKQSISKQEMSYKFASCIHAKVTRKQRTFVYTCWQGQD